MRVSMVILNDIGIYGDIYLYLISNYGPISDNLLLWLDTLFEVSPWHNLQSHATVSSIFTLMLYTFAYHDGE